MGTGGSGGGSVTPVRSQGRVSACKLSGSDSEGRCTPSGRLAGQKSADLLFFSNRSLYDLPCESVGLSSAPDEPLAQPTQRQLGYCDTPGEWGESSVTSKFVINHSVSRELCEGRCNHVLEGFQVQLNRCVFY